MPSSEAEDFAGILGLPFFETSAKDDEAGAHPELILRELAYHLYMNHHVQQVQHSQDTASQLSPSHDSCCIT